MSQFISVPSEPKETVILKSLDKQVVKPSLKNNIKKKFVNFNNELSGKNK